MSEIDDITKERMMESDYVPSDKTTPLCSCIDIDDKDALGTLLLNEIEELEQLVKNVAMIGNLSPFEKELREITTKRSIGDIEILSKLRERLMSSKSC